MRNHNTYSTSLKAYFALGIEKQFVPIELRKKIPSSTSNDWKNQNHKEVIGSELDKKLPDNIKELDILYHPAGKIPRQMALVMNKFIILVQKTVGIKTMRKAFRGNKEAFVNFALDSKDILSIKEFSEILQLSTKTIYDWIHQVKYTCDQSALSLCVKRHSNQAIIFEVQTIKEWLSKPEYTHWGIHSIWARAFKLGETDLSKQSWYRYNKLLTIRKSAQTGKRPPYKSIVASQIHEIWHADITIFKALNGVKYYIYTVMDNYSRFILSWRIEKIVSASFRLQTIQDAITLAFGDSSPTKSVQLVTDGGPENVNTTLKEFMSENSTTIHQTIALKDIVQSNSLMEAYYKITKYSCLYLKTIKNLTDLIREFEYWIHEYHIEKPHYALGIYTPDEVLNGADKHEKFSDRRISAAQKRREFNKNVKCTKEC